MDRLPACYSRLGPFRELFETARPILMYHHVGPRPRGARLKGLYVSPRLFKIQIEELARAGFKTPPFAECLTNGSAISTPTATRPPRDIFLTFDDGFVDVFDHALPVLDEHGFSAIQFVLPDLLGKTNEWQERQGDVSHPLMDAAQVREWLAAGQEIGSHSLTHPWLTRIPIAGAREEIFASKKKLEDLFGRRVDHFCYPYGDCNEAIRDLAREAGYRTACTTRRGINEPPLDPFSLNRFTARYPSRSWKSFKSWLRRKWG
ncbi:MAG TPA: polysaccharide deacetylase family protein [Verrucomicrobiae bacterium]|nr:polysaccharide deacetylase family protein [Verrucomicrobiae bacterium]